MLQGALVFYRCSESRLQTVFHPWLDFRFLWPGLFSCVASSERTAQTSLVRPNFLAILVFGVCLASALASSGQTTVRMLIPGFTVQELPVKLSNINNLRFTPDGKLSALGYDGRV